MEYMRFFLRLVLLFSIVLFAVAAAASNETGKLIVSFFDVGQGDATFIETPTGVQVLIDGGRDGGVLRALSREMGFFDRHIDIIVATHLDEDHVGGLKDVLRRYDVSLIVMTDNIHDTPTSEVFLTAVEEEGAEVIVVTERKAIDLSGDVVLTFLFPDRSVHDLESNTSSIITHLTYGTSDFLFMADAPKSIERYLLAQYGNQLQSEVLKVGHHGSKTSTDEIFISAVNPEYAVISAGKDNRYGHPHTEVIETLEDFDIGIKNTAEDGSITFLSDGDNVFLE